jgi:hypothetical protein
MSRRRMDPTDYGQLQAVSLFINARKRTLFRRELYSAKVNSSLSTPIGIIPSVLTTSTSYSTTTFASDTATCVLVVVQTLATVINATELSSLTTTGASRTTTASPEATGGGIRPNDPLRPRRDDLVSGFQRFYSKIIVCFNHSSSLHCPLAVRNSYTREFSHKTLGSCIAICCAWATPPVLGNRRRLSNLGSGSHHRREGFTFQRNMTGIGILLDHSNRV